MKKYQWFIVLVLILTLTSCAAKPEPSVRLVHQPIAVDLIELCATKDDVVSSLGTPESTFQFNKEEIEVYLHVSGQLKPPVVMMSGDTYDVWTYSSDENSKFICVINDKGILIKKFVKKEKPQLVSSHSSTVGRDAWDAVGVALKVTDFALEATDLVFKVLSKF